MVAMGLWAWVAVTVVAAACAAGWWLRWRDAVADAAECARLRACQPRQPAAFDPALLDGLPEPAQRFFRFAIAPGTPLRTVAQIEMTGQLGLGGRDKPGYRPMHAQQVLAAPHGFVWAVRLPGLPGITGSDSGRWTRFRLAGIVPIARVAHHADHARSAYGRCVAEAVFWTPAAVLPGPGVRWTGTGPDSARVVVTHDGLEQAVDLHVAADGRPLRVSFPRWSDANPGHRYQIQPFGGDLDEFRVVQGFRVPHRVRAGNFYGTPDYFVFFDAEVRSLRYPEG